MPQFGSPAGQSYAATMSLYINDPAQNLLGRNGFIAAEGGITPQEKVMRTED